jgi:hypothetical protein
MLQIRKKIVKYKGKDKSKVTGTRLDYRNVLAPLKMYTLKRDTGKKKLEGQISKSSHPGTTTSYRVHTN